MRVVLRMGGSGVRPSRAPSSRFADTSWVSWNPGNMTRETFACQSGRTSLGDRTVSPTKRFILSTSANETSPANTQPGHLVDHSLEKHRR